MRAVEGGTIIVGIFIDSLFHEVFYLFINTVNHTLDKGLPLIPLF